LYVSVFVSLSTYLCLFNLFSQSNLSLPWFSIW
jgi:hypothetical protein